MAMTPTDVRNKRFGTTRFRGGYADEEVDAFLNGIEASLDRMIQENEELRAEVAAIMRGGIPRVPPPNGAAPGEAGGRDAGVITAADVRNKHFGVTRLASGYIDEEVDEFLSEVESELDRLDRENAELRTRLVQMSRDWERDPARFSMGTASAGWSSRDRSGVPGDGAPLEGVLIERGTPPAYGTAPSFSAAPGYGAVAPVDTPAPARPRRHWMEVDFPTSAPLYAEVGLSVRMCSDSADFTGGQSRAIPVTLIAQTRFELAATSPLQQSVSVPESGGKSEVVRFTFHAAYPGQYSLRVSAFAGGTFLGDLTAELSVERNGRLVRGDSQTAELQETRAVPGEVTLYIRNDGTQFTFQFLSESYALEPVAARALSDRLSEPVQRIAEALRAGVAEHNVRRALEQAGASLWADLVPDLVKEQFWHLRDSITALSVLGNQDTMPWEMLHPVARNQSSGFLAEQFPVLHQVAGQRSFRRLSIDSPLYVIPPAGAGETSASAPGFGQAGQVANEVSALRRRLGAGAGEVGDMDRLLDLIDAGDFGVLHFACHDTLRPDEAGSSVVMGGGRLIPAFLNPAVVGGTLAGRRPLVFLDSSRSEAAIPEYAKLAGWAEQFIMAGAAAFVGASWPVRPASATAFAEAFYGTLQEGQPLGAATIAAREAASADATEPSWLAYSVYGDPSASLQGR
jgi:DivIVA domain-containing protein